MRATKERVAAISRLLAAEEEHFAAQEALLKLAGWQEEPIGNGEFQYKKSLPVGDQDSREWRTLKRTRREAIALEMEWKDHSEAELLATP